MVLCEYRLYSFGFFNVCIFYDFLYGALDVFWLRCSRDADRCPGRYSFFLGGILFYLEHSKRCGMIVGVLPCHQGSFLMSLGRVGVAWRSGEVPGSTHEPAVGVGSPEYERNRSWSSADPGTDFQVLTGVFCNFKIRCDYKSLVRRAQ